MRQSLGVGQIVHRDEGDILHVASARRAHVETSDAAEAVHATGCSYAPFPED